MAGLRTGFFSPMSGLGSACCPEQQVSITNEPAWERRFFQKSSMVRGLQKLSLF